MRVRQRGCEMSKLVRSAVALLIAVLARCIGGGRGRSRRLREPDEQHVREAARVRAPSRGSASIRPPSRRSLTPTAGTGSRDCLATTPRSTTWSSARGRGYDPSCSRSTTWRSPCSGRRCSSRPLPATSHVEGVDFGPIDQTDWATSPPRSPPSTCSSVWATRRPAAARPPTSPGSRPGTSRSSSAAAHLRAEGRERRGRGCGRDGHLQPGQHGRSRSPGHPAVTLTAATRAASRCSVRPTRSARRWPAHPVW